MAVVSKTRPKLTSDYADIVVHKINQGVHIASGAYLLSSST